MIEAECLRGELEFYVVINGQRQPEHVCLYFLISLHYVEMH